jgi:sporulation protein YlmC with PRC-barrel domain
MMKTLAYTTAMVALLATAGIGYADTTATQPAAPAAAMAPADCPAPGSVPEAEVPANCKTDQNATAADPATKPADQNATGTTPAQPSTAAADTKSAPSDVNPANAFLASNFIGQKVYSAANENIGEINDLIMEKDKGMVVAIVGVGGFLGIGEKDVAVALDKITAAKQDNNALKLTISATREELEAAPAFDRSHLTMN